jgi:hypothetical protein
MLYILHPAQELAEQPAQPLEPATALVAPLSLLVRAAKRDQPPYLIALAGGANSRLVSLGGGA